MLFIVKGSRNKTCLPLFNSSELHFSEQTWEMSMANHRYQYHIFLLGHLILPWINRISCRPHKWTERQNIKLCMFLTMFNLSEFTIYQIYYSGNKYYLTVNILSLGTFERITKKKKKLLLTKLFQSFFYNLKKN